VVRSCIAISYTGLTFGFVDDITFSHSRLYSGMSLRERNVPEIIINDTIFFKTGISISVISNHNSFRECCLIKLLPYVLFEKCINILALEVASPGNRLCANCIGALSFPVGCVVSQTAAGTKTRGTGGGACNAPLPCYLFSKQYAGLSSRVVSASDCGVRGSRFESRRWQLCLSRQLLRYTVLSTGYAPLLQCLGRLSLPPFVGR